MIHKIYVYHGFFNQIHNNRISKNIKNNPEIIFTKSDKWAINFFPTYCQFLFVNNV